MEKLARLEKHKSPEKGQAHTEERKLSLAEEDESKFIQYMP